MEIATIVGSITAIVMICGSIVAAGGNLWGFVDPPAAVIIGGGILCGVLVAFPMDEFLRLPKVISKVFFNRKRNVAEIIDTIVSLAETARRDGVLSLEHRTSEINDPFLAMGIKMIVDGMPAEAVAGVLEREIEAVGARHHVGREMVQTLGKASPVFGLVATLMGLVLMLSHMDPATIGHEMGIAILGTFYGAVSANLFLLPFAAKLGYYNKRELEVMELVLLGVLEIQKGENPRVIRLKLSTAIPVDQRKAEEE